MRIPFAALLPHIMAFRCALLLVPTHESIILIGWIAYRKPNKDETRIAEATKSRLYGAKDEAAQEGRVYS